MEENKEIQEQEVKKEEVTKETKNGSLVIVIGFLVVCLVIGIISFYLGTMLADKEDDLTTTTTTKDAITKKKDEEPTTTKLVEEEDNGHKNYDKPDKISYYTTLKYGTEFTHDTIDFYKYDEYELKVLSEYGEWPIENLTIGDKKIDVSYLKDYNFDSVHRFKNFILFQFNDKSDESTAGYIYLFDYNGNMLFDSNKSLISKANNNIPLYAFNGYSYDKENKQLYFNYYDDSFDYSFSNFNGDNFDQHEYDDDYEDIYEDQCEILKNDYILEIKTKITFDNGKINETIEQKKYIRELEVYDIVKKYCKNKYNIDIK